MLNFTFRLAARDVEITAYEGIGSLNDRNSASRAN